MSEPALPVTRSVSIDVAASPEQLWSYVSDPSIPARFSFELVEAKFVDGSTAAVGAVIEGRNARSGFEWSTLSTVVMCDEPRLFRWVVGDAAEPTATWSFEVIPDGHAAVLVHTVTLHANKPPLSRAIEQDPDRAHDIVDARIAELLVSMESTIAGIAALAVEIRTD